MYFCSTIEVVYFSITIWYTFRLLFTFPSKIVEDVYKAIKLYRKAKYSWLADNLGVSERTIQRAIDDLKKLGYIDPEH